MVGVYIPGEDVAQTTFYALFALQHRGQESAGIAVSDGTQLRLHTGMGLIAQVFRGEDLDALPGHLSIGHTRYSTSGASRSQNAQPLFADGPHGRLALGHNGNVINAAELRTELEKSWGVEFDASSDSEVIAELYAKAPGSNWFERSAHCMKKLRGAYSLVMCTERELIAVRDPLGIRPLCLGKLNGGWVVASESAALGNIGAEYVRDIGNGETVVINESGVHSEVWSGARKVHSLCVFEQIYFARPDSILDGKLAYESRMKMGAQLSKEHPVDADLVIGVPDTGLAAAVGYAQESGIPYGEGLIRNRYVGRTFIQPDQRMRDLGVRSKFSTLPSIIGGKRLVVVDDSIVRGSTKPSVVKMLRDAGATEIHVRISSPPIISTCHFGVDMATMRELVAANHGIEAIRNMIGADSLGYLSVEGLMNAVEAKNGSHCNGCFTGRYPIPVQLEMNKLEFETPAIVR